jgi:hypothetical protein
MWKWKPATDSSCVLHGGIAESASSRPDISVLAYTTGRILVAMDTAHTDSLEMTITRAQVTALVALLTEALEVTKERTE